MALAPRLIDAAGHRLAVIEGNPAAAGPPIIFIHGILAGVGYSEVALPECLRQRRWFLLSLPGHFPAEAPAAYRRARVTPSMLRDILAAALQQFAPSDPCVLIGHSTGGLWSLLGAAELPERVHAVCAIGGFAQGRLTGVLGLTQKIARAGAPGRRLAELNLYLLPRMPPIAGAVLGSMVVDRVAARAWPPARESLRVALEELRRGRSADYAHLLASLADIDIADSVRKIRQPCLIIHGEDDPIVPFAQAQLIAELVPHAERQFYPGVGHLPYAERAQRFGQDLNQWLRRLEP